MKGYKIYLGIASVLLVLYLVAQYNRPLAINWENTLKASDKIPYGTYILYHQLPDIFPGATLSTTNRSAYQVFKDSTLKPGNYIIIANSVSIDKNDFNAMLKYIKAGNSVFIAAKDWSGFITDTLKLSSEPELMIKQVGFNFSNPQLKNPTNYLFYNSTNVNSRYFKKFDTTKAVVLGQNEYKHPSYIGYKFGKGNLYLMANPLLLTNCNILQSYGAEFAAKTLSYLPPAKNVYWDQYQNGDEAANISFLRVFFSHPELKWAYYIALAALLLFVLYEVKRRQRIIPVEEPLKNNTLEFVTVVGNVYYEQRDNANIAAKKIMYFSEHLRTAFNLKAVSYEKDFIPILTNKTGIEQPLAEKLVNAISAINQKSAVNDNELILLNQLIEKFYTQSGSHGK